MEMKEKLKLAKMVKKANLYVKLDVICGFLLALFIVCFCLVFSEETSLSISRILTAVASFLFLGYFFSNLLFFYFADLIGSLLEKISNEFPEETINEVLAYANVFQGRWLRYVVYVYRENRASGKLRKAL